jgi:predicted ATPase
MGANAIVVAHSQRMIGWPEADVYKLKMVSQIHKWLFHMYFSASSFMSAGRRLEFT